MVKVAITHHDTIEEAMYKALEYLDIEPIIKGKIVAVKPNDTWASNDDKTAVTQPDTLRGVLEYMEQFNPKQLIVTGGSGAGETDTSNMEFAGMNLSDAIELFTKKVYGKGLPFEHA